MSQEIHSTKLEAGAKTYYFDVKKTQSGEVYLHVKEKRMNYGEEVENDITIFHDHLAEFANELQKAIMFIKGNK